MEMVLKGITAKGKKEHGLVQGTAQHVLLDIARVWGVVGDEAKGNTQWPEQQALGYLAKEYTFYTERTLEVFRG